MPEPMDASADRRPDAIRLTHTGGGFAALANIQRTYAPILGVPTCHTRNQGAEFFVTGDPHDTLYFAKEHDRSGEPRYEWIEQASGIFYGFLVDEAGTSEAVTAQPMVPDADAEAHRA